MLFNVAMNDTVAVSNCGNRPSFLNHSQGTALMARDSDRDECRVPAAQAIPAWHQDHNHAEASVRNAKPKFQQSINVLGIIRMLTTGVANIEIPPSAYGKMMAREYCVILP